MKKTPQNTLICLFLKKKTDGNYRIKRFEVLVVKAQVETLKTKERVLSGGFECKKRNDFFVHVDACRYCIAEFDLDN